MRKKIFFGGFWLILICGFFLRIIPTRGNNFYFTMDQGANAVNSREILQRQQILLKGPETSILGFYNGPLWYWFSALGYFIFQGHPFGPLFLLMLLNLGVCGVLMLTLARKVSPMLALVVGGALQFHWWFYDVSRYSFNPFPLFTFALVEILLLINYLEGSRKSLMLAAIPVGLSFHTELASFPPFLALYILVGVWGIVRKNKKSADLIKGLLVLSLFFIPHLIVELQSNFSQVRAVWNQLTSENAVFPRANWGELDSLFLELVSRGTIFQSVKISLLIIGVVGSWFYFRQKNAFSKRFVTLVSLLVVISFFWFGSTTSWHKWHTVYIPPLVFISVLLMLWSLPRKLGILVFVVIMGSQILIFSERYREYFYPFADASLLTNELAAVDWTYKKSAGQGFYVYSYLPSVYDYPYQYLFWWYGKGTYGYLPCEYSTYPKIPDLFVPGVDFYQEPKRPCGNLRFLIVEPDKNDYLRQKWLEGVREKTKLMEETHIGTITIEKREIE